MPTRPSLESSKSSRTARSRRATRRAVLEVVEPRLLMATFTVTSTASSGANTLRQAILNANATTAADNIYFNISGSGVKTITPTTPLPAITQPVTIDGRSQPGYTTTPVIQISGASAGANADGLTIATSGCFILGLAINRFSDDGIDVESGNDNWFALNHVGTDVTGNSDLGNGGNGFEVSSSDNKIGFGLFGDPIGNVISGNASYGVHILPSATNAASGNLLAANMIGTNLAGTAAVPNDSHGVLVVNASNTAISTNTLSGNGLYNLAISGPTSMGTTIRGNKIGTNAAGTAALGGLGMSITGSNSIVGGTSPGQGNVISGNEWYGVYMEYGTGNVFHGNLVGTNAAGTAALPNNGAGIVVRAPGNTFGGTTAAERNVISGNIGYGVWLGFMNSHHNVVQGNYIGTTASGLADLGNSADGVLIETGTDNTIGGTAPGAGNVISGNNGNGVLVTDGASFFNRANRNKIVGNTIGLGAGGAAAPLPNSANGVWIKSGQDNVVGGIVPGSRNVISWNAQAGVRISGDVFTATRAVVQGNYIGTSPGGTLARPNGGDGVFLDAANNCTIGGTTLAARNVISGNTGSGVRLLSSFHNDVYGNYIGTNVGGNGALGNREGVWVGEVSDYNEIGAALAGAGNVISGNRSTGVKISTDQNYVAGNFIGTDATGTTAVGNLGDGIFIESMLNTIGGTTVAARNVISGNGESGIEIFGAQAGRNNVLSNYIGTDFTGSADLGNGLNGVLLECFGNQVGDHLGHGNLISGNGSSGVSIFNAPDNHVLGNRIGTKADGVSPLGNSQFGVVVGGAASTANHIGWTDLWVGGTPGNTIAHNAFDGVAVASPSMATVMSNAIFSNGGLGIDLGDDGVTANDAGDADAGGNNMQNYPVLTSATTWAGGTAVAGSLASTPNATFRVEFFASAAPDASGHGEGETYLGSTQVTTDASGNATFFAILPVSTAQSSHVSATVSGGPLSQNGYTSEFSATVMAVADVTRPAVSSSDFLFNLAQPAGAPHRQRYAFTENVAQSLEPADLVLQNLTTGQTIAASNVALTYDAATNTATFAFPGYTGGVLPDGRYRATLLAAGVTDAAGNALAADHVSEFFVLAGDANHDSRVNLQDFNILAAHFGGSNKTFSQGDFNYDTFVNLQDFNILAGRFGASVGPEGMVGEVAGPGAWARGRLLDELIGVLT
jgi:titin